MFANADLDRPVEAIGVGTDRQPSPELGNLYTLFGQVVED
jgi:hypothetical protein